MSDSATEVGTGDAVTIGERRNSEANVR